MSEERKRSEAIFVAAGFAAFWLSNYVVKWFPSCYGNYDLQPLICIWNKPLLANCPAATFLFLGMIILAKNFARYAASKEMEKKQKEANWLASRTNPMEHARKHRRIR